ncbi:unnamed protein product [Nezara viridula]|uniref:Uncharacterized protein n=1 Tax=Nezara viridula TaxID=85310 RepID=A0A9P0E5G3_NEZVI|nr:unnamed protein product [Nezara viridula]
MEPQIGCLAITATSRILRSTLLWSWAGQSGSGSNKETISGEAVGPVCTQCDAEFRRYLELAEHCKLCFLGEDGGKTDEASRRDAENNNSLKEEEQMVFPFGSPDTSTTRTGCASIHPLPASTPTDDAAQPDTAIATATANQKAEGHYQTTNDEKQRSNTSHRQTGIAARINTNSTTSIHCVVLALPAYLPSAPLHFLIVRFFHHHLPRSSAFPD